MRRKGRKNWINSDLWLERRYRLVEQWVKFSILLVLVRSMFWAPLDLVFSVWFSHRFVNSVASMRFVRRSKKLWKLCIIFNWCDCQEVREAISNSTMVEKTQTEERLYHSLISKSGSTYALCRTGLQSIWWYHHCAIIGSCSLPHNNQGKIDEFLIVWVFWNQYENAVLEAQSCNSWQILHIPSIISLLYISSVLSCKEQKMIGIC